MTHITSGPSPEAMAEALGVAQEYHLWEEFSRRQSDLGYILQTFAEQIATNIYPDLTPDRLNSYLAQHGEMFWRFDPAKREVYPFGAKVVFSNLQNRAINGINPDSVEGLAMALHMEEDFRLWRELQKEQGLKNRYLRLAEVIIFAPNINPAWASYERFETYLNVRGGVFWDWQQKTQTIVAFTDEAVLQYLRALSGEDVGEFPAPKANMGETLRPRAQATDAERQQQPAYRDQRADVLKEVHALAELQNRSREISIWQTARTTIIDALSRTYISVGEFYGVAGELYGTLPGHAVNDMLIKNSGILWNYDPKTDRIYLAKPTHVRERLRLLHHADVIHDVNTPTPEMPPTGVSLTYAEQRAAEAVLVSQIIGLVDAAWEAIGALDPARLRVSGKEAQKVAATATRLIRQAVEREAEIQRAFKAEGSRAFYDESSEWSAGFRRAIELYNGAEPKGDRP